MPGLPSGRRKPSSSTRSPTPSWSPCTPWREFRRRTRRSSPPQSRASASWPSWIRAPRATSSRGRRYRSWASRRLPATSSASWWQTAIAYAVWGSRAMSRC
jgi:hypothetical protein